MISTMATEIVGKIWLTAAHTVTTYWVWAFCPFLVMCSANALHNGINWWGLSHISSFHRSNWQLNSVFCAPLSWSLTVWDFAWNYLTNCCSVRELIYSPCFSGSNATSMIQWEWKLTEISNVKKWLNSAFRGRFRPRCSKISVIRLSLVTSQKVR